MATEMKKAEMKELLLQQKDHITTLMARLDSEKRFCEKLIGEKYDLEKELEHSKATMNAPHKLRKTDGLVDAQRERILSLANELTEWKEAHESLQARHEEWITTTLEENEGFLGEVRKSGWKEGLEEESARTIQVEMKLKELTEDHQKLKLQTNEQCDVITSQLAEIAALKAENEDMKSRVIDYEYILKENEELKEENDLNEIINEEFHSGILVHSENVLCSYDDVNDFIWGRVKDLVREYDLPYPEVDAVAITNELQSSIKLKKENEALKKENEKLKAAKKPRKPKATKILLECAPMPEINETGVKRFIVVAGGAAAVCADKPEE